MDLWILRVDLVLLAGVGLGVWVLSLREETTANPLPFSVYTALVVWINLVALSHTARLLLLAGMTFGAEAMLEDVAWVDVALHYVFTWPIRLTCAAVLTGLFLVGYKVGYLKAHRFSDAPIRLDHAYGIWCILIPLDSAVVMGVVMYVDDVLQHRMIARYDHTYLSPLHLLGEDWHLYEFRDWLAKVLHLPWLSGL